MEGFPWNVFPNLSLNHRVNCNLLAIAYNRRAVIYFSKQCFDSSIIAEESHDSA